MVIKMENNELKEITIESEVHERANHREARAKWLEERRERDKIEVRRQEQRMEKVMLTKFGLCHYCKEKMAIAKIHFCLECKEFLKESNQKALAKKRLFKECYCCKEKVYKSNLCKKHYANNLAKQNRRYAERKAAMLCQHCDNKVASTSILLCIEHLKKNNEANKIAYRRRQDVRRRGD